MRDLQHETGAVGGALEAVVAVALAGQQLHLALDAVALARELAHPIVVECGRAFAEHLRVGEFRSWRHAALSKPRSALAMFGPRSSER